VDIDWELLERLVDIDWEQLATAAVRAHDALEHVDRHKIDPAWRFIMSDLRQSWRHRTDLTEATLADVKRCLGRRKL
jgi:hypothetical protein